MKGLSLLFAGLALTSSCHAGGLSLLGLAGDVVGDVKSAAVTAEQAGQSFISGLDQGSNPHLKPGSDLQHCPFAGHNTYDQDEHGHSKLELALEAGLHAIEVDESWGEWAERAVVTHDRTALGVSEPKLEDYLKPVWERWAASSDNDYLLVLDLKTASAELAKDIHHILQKQQHLLSHMGADGVFHAGKITVMFTGNGTTENEYEAYARTHGGYLAFGHCGEPAHWEDDAAAMVPQAAPGFRRFLNLNVHDLLPRPGETDLGQLSPERARALIETAHRRGYRVRLWLVNDTRAWQPLIEAHVDWIATDAYQAAADYWRAHQRAGR